MKDRILALLEAEQISPARFAEVLGVQRSGISHILSGRNLPSLDMLTRILHHFPNVSAEWLLRGKGSIYMEKPSEKPAFETAQIPFISSGLTPITESVEPETKLSESESVPDKLPDEAPNKANKIVIFYPDHTFEIFRQR